MRRYFYTFFAFILITSFIVPFTATEAQSTNFKPGDLVKIESNSAVYYYGYDGKRHAFPNEPTYFTWYENFDSVKIITEIELAGLPLGKNIVVRPGTQLVKIVTDPKVYAVEPKGRLRHITSESDARALYGDDWNKNVIDIPDTFFIDYNVLTPLPARYIPTGTVIKEGGDLFVMTNGYTRKLNQDSSFVNYHYVSRYFKELDYSLFDIQEGEDFSAFKVALSDTAQTLIDDNGSDILFYPTGPVGTGTPTRSLPSGTFGNGLNASYFNGLNFETPVLSRIDPEINFNWELRPRTPKESDNIRNIIKKLKFHSAPDTSENDHLFSYPEQFVISFTKDEYLFKTRSLVLTNVTVDYHGEGTPLYYDRGGLNGNKAPANIKLDLSFTETRVLQKADINAGM